MESAKSTLPEMPTGLREATATSDPIHALSLWILRRPTKAIFRPAHPLHNLSPIANSGSDLFQHYRAYMNYEVVEPLNLNLKGKNAVLNAEDAIARLSKSIVATIH